MEWEELLQKGLCMLDILDNGGKMTIDTIKKEIFNNIGNSINVVHNEGRNKIYEYNGKIVEVYPNIFIVMVSDSKRSFSYYDVLTNTVKISFKCK